MGHLAPMTLDEVITTVQAIRGLFAPRARLSAEEIGDGNMNFVFRVMDAVSGRGVIVKHTPPYMRSVGPDWPLTADRLRVEHAALMVQGQVDGARVPKVYHFDGARALLVMENLAGHQVLRTTLIRGESLPRWPRHLGEFLARMLWKTSTLTLDAETVDRLRHQFANADLVRITSDFVLTYPFGPHAMNRFSAALGTSVQEMWTNARVGREVAELRTRFHTDRQALIHGDLHTGSIMVTPQDTRVIDGEFACYGPMGFDLGLLVGHLVLQWCVRAGAPQDGHDRTYGDQLLSQVEELWRAFTEEWQVLASGDRTPGMAPLDAALQQIWEDTVGFAGCEIIRRIVGTSHAPDVEHLPEGRRATVEALALAVGQRLIVRRREVDTWGELWDAIRTVPH